MNLCILSVGSQGDVQPFVALGAGLKRAGFEVTLATAKHFEPSVLEHGLHYAQLRADYLELATSAEGRAALAGNPLRMVSSLRQTVFPMIRQLLEDAWSVSQGADALIYHPKVLAGEHLAEALGVPGFVSLPAPLLTPTRAFPMPLAPRSLGALNRSSYALTRMISLPYRGLVGRWRKEVLGLPPRPLIASARAQPVPALYSFSEHVVPRPSDWPATTAVTGYWFLEGRLPEHPWRPPDELLSFLAAGPAPVYIGFGSMTGDDPERTTELVLGALERTGQRAVLATGWGGLRAAEHPACFNLTSAPHSWLFPRMSALVHHGGAGTTGEGLRAGKPTAVCPFFGDQPFWGRRVFELGVGPPPISRRKLTVEALSEAISRATGDGEMRRRAAALGEKIRAEDGVARAVEVITRRLETPRHRTPTSAPSGAKL